MKQVRLFLCLPKEFSFTGFAKSLGIVEGDLVALSSYATKGQTFLVPVKAIVDQYLGSGLYLSWEQLECLTGQKGVFFLV